MKRIISLLLLAMVTVVLFSCGGEYSEVNDPEPNTPVVSTPPETQTPSEPEHTPSLPQATMFPYGILSSEQRENAVKQADIYDTIVTVIKSKEELTPCIEAVDYQLTWNATYIMDYGDVEYLKKYYLSILWKDYTFLKLLNGYDDAFFAQNFLIAFEQEVGTSSMYAYEVISVQAENGKLVLDVDILCPKGFNEETGYPSGIIVLDKDLAVDAEDIVLKFTWREQNRPE